MKSARKKIAALAVLSILWGTLAAWQWFSFEEPVKVPLTNVSGPVSAQHTLRGASGNLQVHLDLLASSRTQRQMSFSAPRNIFALPAAIAQGSGEADGVENSSQEQRSVLSELAQFHYLGFVRTEDKEERKHDLAVLMKNDDLHVVRKGETIENHVMVKTITHESVTLLDRASRVEHTVQLSEEAVGQPQ